jgi:hypothetical protein
MNEEEIKIEIVLKTTDKYASLKAINKYLEDSLKENYLEKFENILSINIK